MAARPVSTVANGATRWSGCGGSENSRGDGDAASELMFVLYHLTAIRRPAGCDPIDRPRTSAAASRRRRSSKDQTANRQRVAPPASEPPTPIAVWKRRRYTCHGGGPPLGAVYGAVNASPSTCAGQPPSR